MISVQFPTFPAHSFNHFSDYYVMADPALPPNTSTGSIPYVQKVGSHDAFSSASEGRPKAQPGAKRRPSRAGTRSVSTLTAAQLERKRANDREAQRAIRQRTKEHIENLERRVAELSAVNETGAKLMQALKRNEELEQENAILRSRLNHAVASMSENGGTYLLAPKVSVAGAVASQPSRSPGKKHIWKHGLMIFVTVTTNEGGIALTSGSSSPSGRIKLNTQMRASPVSTVGPRSVPVSTVQPSVQQHDTWANAYSPVSAGVERSPSLADVSPMNSNVRWGTPHGQISPPVTEADRMMQPVDTNVQQPVNYNYIVDSAGRPMHYQEQTPMVSYPPSSASPSHITEYHSRQSSAHIAPSPAYASFTNPQTYITASPHEEAMPMMQPTPMHAQHIAYGMTPNMKSE